MRINKRFVTGMIVVAAMLAAGTSQAQFCWTNVASGVQVWSAPGNWTNGAPSQYGSVSSILKFNVAGTYTSSNDWSGVFTNNSLAFGAGTVTNAGGTIAFMNNGAVMPVVTNFGATVTIKNPLILATNTTFAGASNTTVSGVISGAGSLTKVDAGTLTLSGVNDYNGGTYIKNGTVVASGGNSVRVFPVGSTVYLGDTSGSATNCLQLGGGSQTVFDENIVVQSNDGISLIKWNNSSQAQSGSITLGSASSAGHNLIISNLTTYVMTISGAIQDASTPTLPYGSLRLVGEGTYNNTRGFVFSGANTYAGTTTVTSAQLSIGSGGTSGTLGAGPVGNGGFIYFNRTDSYGGAVSNAISGTGAVTLNTGALTLVGSNTYSGATTISAGSLTLSGANGGISGSAVVTNGSGATLKLDNTSSANNGNRLKDTVSIVMNGGTFFFANDGGATSFSETAGALVIAAGVNVVTSSQAGASQTSTLTWSSLSRTGVGTVDFSGTGLGVDSRNKLLITGQSAGAIGGWATYGGGTAWAAYDATLGVIPLSSYTDYTDITALGSTINDGSTLNYRINSQGSGGNITLGNATTTINNLLQNYTTASIVDTASKVFRTGGIMISSGAQSLTIGAAAEDGALMAPTVGGLLSLVNNSVNALTINAAIANNSSASALITAGNVTLNGTNNYTGTTTINGGTLTLGCALPQTLSGVIGGSGGIVQAGSGNLTLSGANTYTGGTTINNGATLAAPVAGSLGTASSGPLVVNGTLNLTAGANTTYTFGNSISGNGTINVTVNTSAQYVTFSSPPSWTSFSGTLNIGVNQPTNSGALTLTVALPSGATVNVTSNSTLYMSVGGLSYAAALNLYGGSLSSVGVYGQVRMDGGTWSGPITLFANTSIGGYNGTPTYSGNIGENGGSFGLSILAGGGAGITLSGVNTYSGDTRIVNSFTTGWFSIANALALQNSTLDMNAADAGTLGFGQNSTLGGLKGSRALNMAAKTLRIGNNNRDTTYSGVLANGAVIKIGTGMLTLSGTNTYLGGTTVSNGTLAINGSVTGIVTVVGGTLGGTGVVAGVVTNFATIGAVDTSAIGMLTVSNLVMKPNSSYAWNYSTSGNTKVYVNATLSLPTVVTVNVTKVSGQMPKPGVLFTGFTNNLSATNLSSWVITGTPTKARAKVVGNQVVLQAFQGTLVTFQ
ncbi:MAG: autotransporter-associated beta strand repeat-containing protein [bacterium]